MGQINKVEGRHRKPNRAPFLRATWTARYVNIVPKRKRARQRFLQSQIVVRPTTT